MSAWRWACLIVIVGMTASFVWAGAEASLADGLRELVSHRWGIVTLVDLYAGLAVWAVVIFWIERDWRVASIWAVGLVLLGNYTTLIYCFARWRHVGEVARRIGVDRSAARPEQVM